MKTLGAVIFGFLMGAIVACGGSSSADNGVTQAQMQAAIAAAVSPLQTQIKTVQGEIPHNLIISGGTSGFGVRTLAVGGTDAAPSASTSTSFTATFLGPPTGNIFGMTQQIGMSSTNYLFISNADGTTESAGMPVTILYEAANCQGPAFTILAAGLSTANIKQGLVFGIGTTGDNVAADYLMLKAGTAPVADFANSELQATAGTPSCVEITPGPNNYTATYPLVQNDPAVSGVPSGPFSPTTLGP